MTFALPHLLWLTLIPLAILLWEITHRRRSVTTTQTKILRAEAGAHSLKLTPSNAATVRSRGQIRPWLCFGLVFAVGAAARPQWGRLEEPVFDQAREILIAIDLSRSMLTPDVKPSRLDRAKLLTQSLLERLSGERIGLMVFSGTAFLQSPLSSDYEILREFLPSLDPDYLPEGGSNYSALIQASLSAFGSTAAADRFLIILSDGEATEEEWKEIAPDLKKKGIRVIGLGVGTSEGALIPDGAGGLVKDERGAVVLSKLESGTLRELSQITDGVYQDASSWIDVATLINSTVEAGKKGEFVEKNTVRLVERFQWPLALGLWCLLVSLYYEFPVRPRPRDLKLGTTSVPTSPTPTSAATTLLALLLTSLLLGFSRPQLAAADPATTEPTASALSKIVGRLATAKNHAARDWAEMALETVTWGSRLKSSQQPVPEGPVRDALTAVDLGEKMDAKTADWPKLRKDLEALLDKPPEQPPEKNQDQKEQDQQQKENQQKQDQKDQQDQQKQDQKQQDQQKQDQQQQQPQDGKQSKDENQQKDQKDAPDKQENESAFGDMKKQEQPPPPPPAENQKVGGVPEKKEGEQQPVDPALALPLQKLEQLRNQDSPAQLFKMMEGEKDSTPRKKTKDW